jgi:hypothetical protein
MKNGGSGRKESEDANSKRKYSPIKETNSEEEEKYTSSEHYSSSKFEESSSRVANHKSYGLKKQLTVSEKKRNDPMRESYVSSSMSTEKPV